MVGEGAGWGLWHLLSGDRTAALKHAELISIVMSQARSESAVGHG